MEQCFIHYLMIVLQPTGVDTGEENSIEKEEEEEREEAGRSYDAAGAVLSEKNQDSASAANQDQHEVGLNVLLNCIE